ncbi:bifunctional diaminohydroxyphosphoribosylaminopyrimidine deaminase/5-amino-6-(5-phosphoribosylamino)uracil reductase RibD [Piscinibacter sp. Jin2]|uniref:Riboflavin biosynthesis protein RibD n=1 Tax=Aquariibacter lacus TaxID=2801332 RepID=A0A9X0XF46_9BURK|nr:bifunctional diaminohydroxyphosphoribosylaminopyrimidine deaminase/5-amino-6-(5-phosphoribosylamino)uracil reductase RibD [Piscinibacter lacus]MBL0720411.1 bifunctional diaminohydroxyphosphoribosylaminopyrimidine deaminase/5-amino-6-(5-phosphoribosylamino)uracil reductase RibD [Piscinibacter lacus]
MLPPLAPAHLQAALDEATRAIGLSEPNPRVGCLLIDAEGREIARGHTQQAGGPHAEIVALRAAEAAGRPVRGATAIVTLEPCSHHGRTPPCCDALVAAGLARVVVANVDPNPLVAGRGLARLQAAGLHVELLADSDWAHACRELNLGFFSRMVRGRPWLRMKIAASLDGRTALENGASQWITGEAARRDGHAWRRRAGAVLTGIGTLKDDNPRLDVRLVETAVQPLRVVVDARLETPPDARLLQPPGRVWIYHAVDAEAPEHAARAAALRAAGAGLSCLPDAQGKVDLAAMLDALSRDHAVNELHVEAGHKLNGSLVRAGRVDEFLVYLAPRLLAGGLPMASFGPLSALDQSLDLRFERVDTVGGDLRLIARPPGRARF